MTGFGSGLQPVEIHDGLVHRMHQRQLSRHVRQPLVEALELGALAAELQRDDLGVLAFWSDAVILTRLGQKVTPAELLENLLRIPARGLTNIYFPLQLARRQLATVPARDARVLLLSDCVHNAGPDPRLAVAGLNRLDVLLDTSGEHDVQMARDLARLGHGRLVQATGHRAVAPARSSIFAG